MNSHPRRLSAIALPQPKADRHGSHVGEGQDCTGRFPSDQGGQRYLCEGATAFMVPAKRAVFREGFPAEFVFVVLGGAFSLSRSLADGRRQITGISFPGDVLTLPSGPVYGCSAEALMPSRVCKIGMAKFNQLLTEFPVIGLHLIGILSGDLVAAQEQVILLGRGTAAERIVSFLLRLSARARAHGLPASPIELPMSRGDIADYLGLALETVSRGFSELKKKGLIDLDGNTTVHLRRIAALQSMTGEHLMPMGRDEKPGGIPIRI